MTPRDTAATLRGEDPFASLGVANVLLPRPAITNYQEWRAFVEESVAARPTLLTLAEYRAMSDADRKPYNDERKRYHSRFGPLETPQLKNVHDEALRLAAINYGASPGARPGVILDGLGTVGKTTIVMHLGRKYERALRRKLKLPGCFPNGDLFVPVVYISLPGDVTIKAFNWLVVEYFNIPAPRSAREEWLTRQIVRIAKACGTSMFIVDDIHFVKMKNRTGETINNHFKFLANCISSTFVYAGINLEGTQLLSEGASREKAIFSQTKHRFKKYDINPYHNGGTEYRSLLASFEHHLLLVKQEPGMLVDQLANYIHGRTAGYIGAISNLLREGANLAIDRGDERLSTRLLDQITLDHAAEEYSGAATGRGRRSSAR